MQAILRPFTARLEQTVSTKLMKAIGEGMSNASTAMTAKGTGDDAMKVVSGKMSPSEFGAKLGTNVALMLPSAMTARLIGPNMGNYAGVMTDFMSAYKSSK